jgi:hypothetical protein
MQITDTKQTETTNKEYCTICLDRVSYDDDDVSTMGIYVGIHVDVILVYIFIFIFIMIFF